MRRRAAAAARNSDPIADVLRTCLPRAGLVLEIASGTGEHALHFARAFPHLTFRPTDFDPDSLASIAAWREAEGPANLLAPLRLDAAAADWPVDRADAILCINMVHISPWAATAGLMAGAGRLLQAGALLYLYGPYRRNELATAPSNEAFDVSLRERDPDWGLRQLEDVIAEGSARGLAFERLVEMPANNLSLVFRRT